MERSSTAHKGLRRFVTRLVALLEEEKATRTFGPPEGAEDEAEDPDEDVIDSSETSLSQETSDEKPETSD